jgi:drug/metabolite transporter (DMT)-like permease
MLAILGGLGAALAFAGSTLCSSRSSRLIPPASVLAWVMAVGMVVVTPFVIVEGVPSGLDAGAVAWFAIAGVGNVGGLLVAYAALRIADVGLVAPILSTQGAIAALIAVAAGEHLGAASAIALVVVALGVVVSATAPASVATEGARPRRAVALASTAALVFGVGLYAIGRVGADLSVAWAVLPARLVGVVCVAAPLALAGRLRLTRAAAPLVIVGGLCEAAGFACIAAGSRDSIATTAVLSSQFAAIAAIAAVLLFAEPLGRARTAGIVTIGAGIAVLGALQA